MAGPKARFEPDPLRAFLWGKRQSRRHALVLDVALEGTLGAIPAMSLDVSAGGVLLRVPTDALNPRAASDGDVDPFMLVQTHLRGACRARFEKCDVKAHVEVVRLDLRPTEPEFLYVGCRFSRALDEEQLRRFALDPKQCAPELHALPSDMMPWRARGDACIGALYADDDQPCFEGEVLGIGPSTLCLRLQDASEASTAANLGARELRLEVFEGDRVDWETGARLSTIGFPNDGRAGLELGLVVNGTPGKALRRRFRPVAAK
jgi:hypothetical protein